MGRLLPRANCDSLAWSHQAGKDSQQHLHARTDEADAASCGRRLDRQGRSAEVRGCWRQEFQGALGCLQFDTRFAGPWEKWPREECLYWTNDGQSQLGVTKLEINVLKAKRTRCGWVENSVRRIAGAIDLRLVCGSY